MISRIKSLDDTDLFGRNKAHYKQQHFDSFPNGHITGTAASGLLPSAQLIYIVQPLGIFRTSAPCS